MRSVFIAGVAALLAAGACATPRASGPSGDGVVTLDPIEPVAAYLEEGRGAPGGAGEPARIRVEVLEIAVSPTRADGGLWDGGRLLDDAAQARLTEALGAPDAARRVPSLLRDFAGRTAPDTSGEIALSGGATVALPKVADAAVRPGAAPAPAPLAPDTTLRIRLVDEDEREPDPVGEVVIERDALLDALRAGAPAVLDLRGSGSGAIWFVTLQVSPS
jgi:hypothetical protein